jgi:hypothetical protein
MTKDLLRDLPALDQTPDPTQNHRNFNSNASTMNGSKSAESIKAASINAESEAEQFANAKRQFMDGFAVSDRNELYELRNVPSDCSPDSVLALIKVGNWGLKKSTRCFIAALSLHDQVVIISQSLRYCCTITCFDSCVLFC